jgi:glycosyltransferase involved in cell wall biosynthesis
VKIFIESSAIFSERSGIGQFAIRLIEAYHKQYPNQQIRLFGFKFVSRKFVPPIPRDKSLKYRLVRWLPGRIYTGSFKNNVPIPIDTLIGAVKKDIVVFPNFVRWPLLTNRRSISFIHDLSFVHYGEYSSPANREYMLKFVPKTLQKSEHLVTISENSKKEIIEYFNIPSKKISIVHPFIDTAMFNPRPSKEVEKVRNKFSLPKKYLLFVSSLEPRKNVLGILNAYAALPVRLKKEYALVLAGGKGWLNEEIHSRTKELLNKKLNIYITGYVSDDDLPALYTGAQLFVFPSFYEGFGIPPLEAMACGVPVITSDNSSLPEVVGDAAIQVDAHNTVQITNAITYLLDNPAIQKDLAAKGFKQCKKFSPENSARQLQTVLEKV